MCSSVLSKALCTWSVFPCRLAGKLKEAQTSKEKISQEIQKKEDYLDTLQPKLSSILEVNHSICPPI